MSHKIKSTCPDCESEIETSFTGNPKTGFNDVVTVVTKKGKKPETTETTENDEKPETTETTENDELKDWY